MSLLCSNPTGDPNSYGAKAKVHETSYRPDRLGNRSTTTLILISKTTLRFSNFLEGLKNSLTTVILTAMVYYSKRIPMISQNVAFLDSAWGRAQKNH